MENHHIDEITTSTENQQFLKVVVSWLNFFLSKAFVLLPMLQSISLVLSITISALFIWEHHIKPYFKRKNKNHEKNL